MLRVAYSVYFTQHDPNEKTLQAYAIKSVAGMEKVVNVPIGQSVTAERANRQ
jgi:hypothetical protein